jgi:hypothetical protein
MHACLAAAATAATLFIASSTAHASGGRSCEDSMVLWSINQKFRINDRNVLKMGLKIEDFYDIHEKPYTPNREYNLIPRRFCKAKVAMNDGNNRTIWYVIENGQGLAGISYYVDYCISGLDPWHIYGAFCRSVRPGGR